MTNRTRFAISLKLLQARGPGPVRQEFVHRCKEATRIAVTTHLSWVTVVNAWPLGR